MYLDNLPSVAQTVRRRCNQERSVVTSGVRSTRRGCPSRVVRHTKTTPPSCYYHPQLIQLIQEPQPEFDDIDAVQAVWTYWFFSPLSL